MLENLAGYRLKKKIPKLQEKWLQVLWNYCLLISLKANLAERIFELCVSIMDGVHEMLR